MNLNNAEQQKSFGFNSNAWQPYTEIFFMPQDLNGQFDNSQGGGFMNLNQNQQNKQECIGFAF